MKMMFKMGTAAVLMSFTLDEETFNSKGEREREILSFSFRCTQCLKVFLIIIQKWNVSRRVIIPVLDQ